MDSENEEMNQWIRVAAGVDEIEDPGEGEDLDTAGAEGSTDGGAGDESAAETTEPMNDWLRGAAGRRGGRGDGFLQLTVKSG